MNIVLRLFSTAFFATVVLSAPLVEDAEQLSGYMINGQLDYQRDKRLDNSYYAVSPCAAASAGYSPVTSFVPEAGYQNFGPIQARFVPSEYNYGNADYLGNLYRTEDPYKDEREIMRYSDANFVEQMPNIYRYVPSYVDTNAAKLAGLSGQVVSQGSQAYGVYSNANVGGCNVPLLFSCTPSVVAGHMVSSQPHNIAYGNLAPAIPSESYRGVHNHYPHGTSSNHEDQSDENANSVNSNSAQHR